ncbi:MAG: hypothetical protein CMG26_04795 [Candidatus Marinimicrobia bacterium]|nr:hypothetical protein [Candidatus Neomarinimicrobiota bacterium]
MNREELNKPIFQLFTHLEGIVIAPTILSLVEAEIIKIILKNGKISLSTLSSSNTQIGYLNVALTSLCSLGVLNKSIDEDDTKYFLTSYGQKFLKQIEFYNIYKQIKVNLKDFILNDISSDALNKHIELVKDYSKDYNSILRLLHKNDNEISYRIAKHIEGIILYPIILFISYHKSDQEDTANLEEFIKTVLSQNKYINVDETYQFILSRAKSYGVTASYQPILSDLDKTIFSNKNLIYSRNIDEKEIHVNRKLNVWGSGGAHKTYFNKIDSIITDIFNSPIEKQPKGIADMGCGDGMFLEHIYKLITQNTLRGRHLDKYPLLIIGADLNQEALDVANLNLKKAHIESNFLISDISNPEKYKDDLNDMFGINIKDLLHVRSFLDHNRIFQKVQQLTDLSYKTSCAYAFKGNLINSEEIISNLIYHLNQWKKHISKHGLLMLELHGVNPSICAKNKFKTPTIAYEATHGYSDQFIVEYDVFLKCAKAAGLKKNNIYSKVFPRESLTTISINVFK